MISFNLGSLKKQLISFIHLQLFITLISMPILLCWGLPLSLLTFAGNFFLSPILTVFLLLSSLIFFCYLLCIPHGILITALEQAVSCWLWLMQWADYRFLVAFTAPSSVLIFIIPLGALAILHSKHILTQWHAIGAYSCLLLATCLYLKMVGRPAVSVDTVECNKKQVHCINTDNQLIIVDPGSIGRRISAASWCEYTLLTFLAKSYGTTSIDHFIILQPNKVTFDALQVLLNKCCIKHIYMPFWQGKIPWRWWRSYRKLKEQCIKHNCTLHRLYTKPRTISISKTSQITLSPLEQHIVNDTMSYACFKVAGTIASLPVEIYSNKYHKK